MVVWLQGLPKLSSSPIVSRLPMRFCRLLQSRGMTDVLMLWKLGPFTFCPCFFINKQQSDCKLPAIKSNKRHLLSAVCLTALFNCLKQQTLDFIQDFTLNRQVSVSHVAVEGELLHVPERALGLVLTEMEKEASGVTEDNCRVSAGPSFELLLATSHEDCHHRVPLTWWQQLRVVAHLERHLSSSDSQDNLTFAYVLSQFGRTEEVLPCNQEPLDVGEAKVTSTVVFRDDDDWHFFPICKQLNPQSFFIVFTLIRSTSVEQLKKRVKRLSRASQTASLRADRSFKFADKLHHLQCRLQRVLFVFLGRGLHSQKARGRMFPNLGACGELYLQLLVDA